MSVRQELPTENPYASPSVACQLDDQLQLHPELSEIRASCEVKRMLFRRLRLSGFVEGTLEWDAQSVLEIIRVGKKTVARTCPFWYTPRFDFVMLADDMPLPSVIEVRLSLVLPIFVRKFRLLVNGQIVYSEGTWPDNVAAGAISGIRRRPR